MVDLYRVRADLPLAVQVGEPTICTRFQNRTVSIYAWQVGLQWNCLGAALWRYLATWRHGQAKSEPDQARSSSDCFGGLLNQVYSLATTKRDRSGERMSNEISYHPYGMHAAFGAVPARVVA